MSRSITYPTKAQRRGIAMIPLTLILVSCAGSGPRRIPLPDVKHSQLRSTTVVAPKLQELGMRIERSTTGAAVGGFLGAVVDSTVNTSRAKDAESAVASVRNALADYDPVSILAAAMGNELASVAWLNNDGVVVRQFADQKAVQDWIQDTKAENTLVVDVDYTLVPSGQVLLISVKAAIYPRAPEGAQAASPKPLYANAFAWAQKVSGLKKRDATPAEAANLWAAEGGRQARLALDAGMKETAQMIAFDLGEDGPVGTRLYTAPESAQEATRPLPPGIKAGYVVRHREARSWVRLPAGDLISVRHVPPPSPK
jgi:hypothetical protein